MAKYSSVARLFAAAKTVLVTTETKSSPKQIWSYTDGKLTARWEPAFRQG